MNNKLSSIVKRVTPFFIKNSLKTMIDYSKIVGLRPKSKDFVLDYIREAEVANYLSKYSYVLNHLSEFPQKSAHVDKIWQLWYQGLSQAPIIVRKCVDTVQEFSEGRNVIILHDKNIEDYISIPSYIYDKKEKGHISNTHFSDILRTFLLAEHGGIWIDSSVMLTSPIPGYILNAPFFCFADTPPMLWWAGTNTIASSWFIHSAPNQIIMRAMKDLLCEYWKHENNCRHYYLFHLIFALVISSKEEYMKEWGEAPFFSNVPPHVLQMELFKNFNKERFEQIKQMSAIHKLTWKLGRRFDTKKTNTFYDVLINGRIKQT
jgi:hypothetical protein